MDEGIRLIDENGGSELVFERMELGEERDLEERPLKSKVINAGVLVVAALISLLLLANIASSPSTYSGMYETLDEKKLNVMGLAATTTAASAAISVLPDDTGSAIADKLADFASYFVVILSVIYLEKFLLTTFGFLAFGILIPVACVLFAIAIFLRRGTLAKVNLQRLGTKLAAFGLALALVVPASVWLTDNIDKTFDESIAASNAAAQQATQELEESVQEDTQEDKGLLEGIADAVQDGFTAITQGVSGSPAEQHDRHGGCHGGDLLSHTAYCADGFLAGCQNHHWPRFRWRFRRYGRGPHKGASHLFFSEEAGTAEVALLLV